MREEYDAIVVGGGIAGLTSAAYLCRSGLRTLLIEKNEKTGGLVNTFWHQGFAFDGGIRAFENSGILIPMLKNLGIDMEFIKNPVSIGIENQWECLRSRESLQDYVAMLTGAFPANAMDIARIMDEIKKVMKYMDVLYGIDNPLFLEDMRDPVYLRKTLLPWLLNYQKTIRKIKHLNEPVYTYLQRFTTNDALIDMITQHFFNGTPTFFALSYFGLYLDYLYPMGGTGTLPLKLTEFIHKNGGVILTGTTVMQIDSKKNEAVLSDGQIVGYKKLVWAADQKTLYRVVKEPNSKKVKKQRLIVEAGEGAESILTLFLEVNLDKDYFMGRCGVHAFYTPNTVGLSSSPSWKKFAKSGSDSLLDWVGAYLKKTTYEISCPSLRDSSLAPEGKTGIIVSTLMDYSLVRHFSDSGEYEAYKEYCTQKIIEVLEMSIFPNLRDQLLFSMCATPMTIEKESGNSHGTITGWAFTKDRMPSEKRFNKITRSIKTPINDIVQCGQWTFSPAGLPVCVMTGKLAADVVHKALKG